MYIYINYHYCNINYITTDIFYSFFNILYVSSVMYYINIVIDYYKLYIYIDYHFDCIQYYKNIEQLLYLFKNSLGTALSTSLSSVYSYFTYMIGLTKRSHVAIKMQHVTFCDSIIWFDWCRTKRIDTVCGVTWIPLCARDGSVITWGRGEGETLSHHVVSTQCAGCLRVSSRDIVFHILYSQKKIFFL